LPFALSLDEGKFLVELARKAVKENLTTGKHLAAPQNTPKKLLRQCGIFVTINTIKHGETQLRGCIGYPYPTLPLVEAVIESAIDAATQDPRFYTLTLKELGNVVFEVSVLTPPEVVKVQKPDEYVTKIKIGEDGLIIEKGVFKGLLLPQVPVEWKWDEEEFLCQCCIKAGLPPDTWLTKSTGIFKFQAIIFEEEIPNGKIKQLHLGKT